MFQRIPGRAMAAVVAVVLLVATFATFRSQGDTRTVSAHFSRTVQLYTGSEVRILGVTVGNVTAVVPEGNSVRVDMEYDAQYKVPANAKAVIVTPTLTADRFVQLTPAYTKGPRLKDGADIPLAKTGSPVELDRIYSSIDTLATALGPNGANKHGALDDLMHAGASALKGQGAKGNKMIVAMSKAVKTFGDGSGQLFATVRGLAQFSNALARNDRFVSAFITHLATVSTQLAGERGELRAALARLAGAVGVVRTFVHDNKGKLEGDLKALTQVSTTLAQEKNNIAIALEKAPLGLNNLALGYDNQSNGEGGGFNMKANVSSVHLFLCALVRADKLPDANVACKVFTKLLGPLEDRAGQSSGPPTPTLPKILKNGNRLKLGKSTPVTSLSGLLGGSR